MSTERIRLGGMALGVLVTGRKLKGSCGGLGGSACSCSPEKREQCGRAEGHAEPGTAHAGFARHADVPIEPSSLARARPEA